MPGAAVSFDVTVIGGGLAGMAASLDLAKAGLRVVCIEAETGVRQPVGESLDWASPALLSNLGLPLDYLIRSGIATYKRGVTLQLGEEKPIEFRPSPWVARAPFNVVPHTLHVDRMRLDAELRALVAGSGVTIVNDRAIGVEKTGRRIQWIQAASGAQFSSPWYLDASGSLASFLAREFDLPAEVYGPRKVCLWSYFEAPQGHEGTTIYMESVARAYQEWIWEIPIGPNTLSVGYVTTGAAVKIARDRGLAIEDIFRLQLQRFSRLAGLVRLGAGGPVKVTSFGCRSYRGIAGPNWVIAGEAASMVDPITSNGVTSALRHAEEAAAMIVATREKSAISCVARISYSNRVLRMGQFFNGGIEKLVYDWPVREQLGARRAAKIYTAAAWSMNAVYSRSKPRGALSTLVLASFLDLLRAGAWMLHRICRMAAHREKSSNA